MSIGFALSLLLATLPAAPPPGYYGDAATKTGTALRQTLHAVIRNHTVIPYTSSSFDTSDALKLLDEDPANTNNVILRCSGPVLRITRRDNGVELVWKLVFSNSIP